MSSLDITWRQKPLLGRMSISFSWLSRTSASFMGVREIFSSAAIRVSEYSTLG
jgi:hypothetical protein